ncbi:PAS domain S-box [Desulfocapsa sulfexigens DSM 10523]|uniref:histidine kinase n=1 Tax=Desulfocapsa sulfexigens (strain DSM 10523 / SB164P1) TaxID=1167006 RepID=M1PST9_DESSD|nr:PAS domain S-box protein [Desulfocapsa sulfexigens]AGF79386.1 PAS domain S-box [Desulfocapsa sulfexigens DSM 10523]
MKNKKDSDDLNQEGINQVLARRLTESQRIAHIGSWEHNLETNETFFSEEFFRLCGLDSEKDSADFELFFSILHSEDQPLLKKTIAETLQSHKPFNIDYRIILKDGSIRYIRSLGEIIPDSAGNLVILSGTSQDITDRKKAEETMKRTESLYRSFIDSMKDVAFLKDDKLRYLIANRATCDFLGLPVEEVLGKTDFDLMHEDAANACRKTDIKALTSSNGIFVDEESFGDTIFETRKFQIRLADNVFGVGAYITDVTARKRSEEKLQESEEYTRNILDTVDVGLIVVDRDYRIITANNAYRTQIGQQFDDKIIGKHCYELSHLSRRPCFEAGEECAVRGVFEDGVLHTTVHKHINRDGKIQYMETKAFPNKDKAGNVTSAIAVIHNITERHLLEAEQLRTQKLEAIGTLAGGIAHDFNNLLQGVFGYISMAKIKSSQPEEVIRNLEQAEKALSLSVNLTTQLLTFAKGGNPVKKKIYLQPVIENATKFALSGSRCDYLLHLDPNLWQAEVDEGQIAQVIQNIVLNASEAMPEGGVVDILSENITLLHEGRHVRIIIKDSGIGIPEAYRSKVFDPYFTTKQKGSGLGLATSYSIVKNHGGSIKVEASQNNGTSFIITLPACESEILKEKTIESAIDMQKQNGRILLMDDDTMIRDVALSMIELLGHNLELASHGEEAIEKYQVAFLSENPFDFVILDLTVKGGMGGQETMLKLQEIDPNVRAVVSSGYSDDPVVSGFPDYGFQGMLNKPYTIKELKECLSEMIN